MTTEEKAELTPCALCGATCEYSFNTGRVNCSNIHCSLYEGSIIAEAWNGIAALRNPLPFREASEKPDAWLIWSNEHKAYWRPSSQGYVYNIDKAGRYSLAEAMLICDEANIIMREGKNPTEIVTPSPELIAAWKEGKEEG